MTLAMPDRDINLCFMIDTNHINAKNKNDMMNQIELWGNNGVITLITTETTIDELCRYPLGAKKGSGFVRSINVNLTLNEKRDINNIEKIIFPMGVRNKNQENDVKIVFDAFKYNCILITNDGGSKSQPRGILGRQNELCRFGVRVIRDYEAVRLIRQKICERDDYARRISNETGQELPQYVGED